LEELGGVTVRGYTGRENSRMPKMDRAPETQLAASLKPLIKEFRRTLCPDGSYSLLFLLSLLDW
jgi:hypothetical protein